MSNRVSYVLMYATALLSSATVIGCKEDPPPPPVATTPAADGSVQSAPGASANAAPTKVARVDPETTKHSRLEACYWGSMGVAITRDAYLASMKAGEPSATLLPDFGEFPEHKKRAEAMKKAGREETTRATNMPYLRHLRSCKHAKSATTVKMPGVDEALAEWEPYASKLHETLVKATRYYSRKAYEKDDFKEGKQHDATLKELLPQFDDKLAAFGKAMDTWREANKDWKPKEELDEGGKVAQEALTKARALTQGLMGETRDKAATDKLLGELKTLFGELETIREEKRRPPHPKVFGPKLGEFVDAAAEAAAIEGDGKLTLSQLYSVTGGLGLMYELNQRSLEQLLRQKSAAHRKPLRTLDPRKPAVRREGEKGDPSHMRPQRRRPPVEAVEPDEGIEPE